MNMSDNRQNNGRSFPEGSLLPRIDRKEGEYWLYPTNYEIRDYQVNITEQALFKNTLVCLPTGLGKTLIASVVMHAFYRWFPSGMTIFLAPTKPLVAQQIQACHKIMGIMAEDTAHLEGSITAAKRRTYWNSRRVIFCTPQTLQNDLSSGNCPGERVVCVVKRRRLTHTHSGGISTVITQHNITGRC